MNKKILLIFLLLILLQKSHAESTQEDISTLDKYKKYATSHQNPTDEESIEKLGIFLFQTSSEHGKFNSSNASIEAEKEAHAVILESITSNDLYAEYYYKIITDGTNNAIERNDVARERDFSFLVLEQIPTPDVIKIMGELLNDTRNPWADVPPNAGDDGGRFIPSDQYAAICLTSGDLRSKPKMTDSGCRYKEDRDAWREWFQQVKSGKRTFSFEGQNVCYRFLPDGSYETLPLSKSIGEDKPIQSRRLPKMDTRKVQAPLTSSVTVHQASPFPWSTIAWLVGGFGLLTIGGGFLWARRNLK